MPKKFRSIRAGMKATRIGGVFTTTRGNCYQKTSRSQYIKLSMFSLKCGDPSFLRV